MAKPRKIKLAELLVARGLVDSLDTASRVVMAGQVLVNGNLEDKSGLLVPEDAQLDLAESKEFVGRGALKLTGALSAFNVEVKNFVCADVGSSTGGFTEVLLKNNAARVYAIDVGYGELAWELRSNDRVVVMERTNARYLESLPEKIDLATIDVSFISLSKIFPAVVKWLTPSGIILPLVKPQFEAKRELVGEGGIVRERSTHQLVLKEVAESAKQIGIKVLDIIPSPIEGAKGNIEFFMKLSVNDEVKSEVQDDVLIEKALDLVIRNT